MAIMSGFQPEDESSILSIRSMCKCLLVHVKDVADNGSKDWKRSASIFNLIISGKYASGQRIQTVNLAAIFVDWEENDND